MIIVADASVLVGKLLRDRGRNLILHPQVQLVVAEHQWSEVEHELERRLSIMESRGRISAERRSVLEGAVQHLVDVQGIELIPRTAYEQFEEAARRRVPRDPNDWAPVALAMALDAGILTGDNDFLGCGCPTWTVETLRAELGKS
jgi:predicted nucleic acid-binding protein